VLPRLELPARTAIESEAAKQSPATSMKEVGADCLFASVAAKALPDAHGESLDSAERASASIIDSGMDRVALSVERDPIRTNCPGCGTVTRRHMNALSTLTVVALAPIQGRESASPRQRTEGRGALV
jgi:hypothetical protein